MRTLHKGAALIRRLDANPTLCRAARILNLATQPAGRHPLPAPLRHIDPALRVVRWAAWCAALLVVFSAAWVALHGSSDFRLG